MAPAFAQVKGRPKAVTQWSVEQREDYSGEVHLTPLKGTQVAS